MKYIMSPYKLGNRTAQAVIRLRRQSLVDKPSIGKSFLTYMIAQQALPRKRGIEENGEVSDEQETNEVQGRLRIVLPVSFLTLVFLFHMSVLIS